MVLCLSCATAAQATTGGPSGDGSFCLERDGRRILYLSSQSGESGTLMAIDVATGQRSRLVECSQQDEERTRLLASCEPLQPVALSELGWTLRVSGQITPPPIPEEPPEDITLLRITCPQTLTVKKRSRVLGSVDFAVCCVGPGDSAPRTVRTTVYVAPGKRFALLQFSYLGNCYETGYQRTEFMLLRSVFGPAGSPAMATGAAPLEVPLAWPPIDYPAFYNTVGMQLYRRGDLWSAEPFFATAYQRSLPGKPHLLSLYNRAAALARLGVTDRALAALEELFAFEKERATYVRKVQADADFDSLREHKRLRELIAPNDAGGPL